MTKSLYKWDVCHKDDNDFWRWSKNTEEQEENADAITPENQVGGNVNKNLPERCCKSFRIITLWFTGVAERQAWLDAHARPLQPHTSETICW